VSGGYLFSENNPLLQDRLYLNDGKGNFRKADGAIPPETFAGSCAVPFDVDLDGDMDLFVGSRLVPGRYPESPQNMLLLNDGKGKFTESMKSVAPELANVGMVCDARAVDINLDKKPDLIVAGDWTPVKIFINEAGKLRDRTETWLPKSDRGWWNCLIAEDFDGDGDQDVMAGNYGLNTQFKVSDREPATLVYKDFDHDGSVDPFFCYYIDGISYPFASRDEALGQVSMLKPRFPDYNAYSKAKLEDIFRPAELEGAVILKADELRTLYLENKDGRFEIKPLPIQAQFSPVYAMAAFDVDGDGDKDVIMGGNDIYMRVRIGKTDANKGFVFLNDGKGNFAFLPQGRSGLNLSGDTRSLTFVTTPKGPSLLAGGTGEAIHVIRLKSNFHP
jgi:hypothetical protein